jgi:hypothetical protein
MNSILTRRFAAPLGAAFFLAAAWVVNAASPEEDEYAPRQFREIEVVFPEAPRGEALVDFYVSPTNTNRFYVDGASLSVGEDGVVRYTLVVEAGGGARNVSYEGIRCETRELRLYATGRGDGSWARSRNDRWRRIVDTPVNRHHAELYFNYFCPGGAIITDAAAGRAALRAGGHPNAVRGRP